jgi:hypothetical protein
LQYRVCDYGAHVVIDRAIATAPFKRGQGPYVPGKQLGGGSRRGVRHRC